MKSEFSKLLRTLRSHRGFPQTILNSDSYMVARKHILKPPFSVQIPSLYLTLSKLPPLSFPVFLWYTKHTFAYFAIHRESGTFTHRLCQGWANPSAQTIFSLQGLSVQPAASPQSPKRLLEPPVCSACLYPIWLFWLGLHVS